MNLELLDLLRCPKTGQRLVPQGTSGPEHDVVSGYLVSENGECRYPIIGGIPRFVPQSNYADNFGMQWNHFRQTQLDSHSGKPISTARFWQATGWSPALIKGQWVLDAGCGAGRFAEVALKAGAKVVALDYSSAVDACYINLKNHPNLHLVQGDIYALPFAPNSFPFIYSLGVLQHTPDVARAFAALPLALQEKGCLCVDYYEKTWKSMLLPKYWLRPITKRIPKRTLFFILRCLVPLLLPLSRLLGAVPLVGPWLKRLIPVLSYHGILPLNKQQHYEWSLLDTFDMFSPEYDSPQSKVTARSWMESAGMNNIEIFNAGHLVARGTK